MTIATILVVDDNPFTREIAAEHLSSRGHRVLQAEGGRQALEMIQRDAIDAVILDVMMPGLDGPSTLARMRADPALRSIPVVFMTAKAMPEERAGFLRMGAAGVIPKPFDPMSLAGQVTELWARLPG